MHPRNKHIGRYDLNALTKSVPELGAFVRLSPAGEPTIDFADAAAVKVLNRALLKSCYGVERWDIPPGALCPAVPGRADYVHHAADLLASVNGGTIPRGGSVRVLDIGVGANCIYPIIGRAEYGWSFLGTEIDPMALACAQKNVDANPSLREGVELRAQTPPSILKGILSAGERCDLTLCNPPFNASLEEAQAGSARKWENLKRAPTGNNFGGQGSELWTSGGEATFVWRMIQESVALGAQVVWFSALISRSENLPSVLKALKRVKPSLTRVVEMSQGRKKSRLAAWTFLDEKRLAQWRRRFWATAAPRAFRANR